MPTINENIGEFITLTEAAAMTASFRQHYPTLNKATYYGKIKIQELLDQDHLMGIRIYNAFADGVSTTVLVGVDDSGNDMSNGLLLDKGMVCPPYCPDASPLL